MTLQNLLATIPAQLDTELIEQIASKGKVVIERILSRGQSSPTSGWYDQPEDEWVLLLEGEAMVDFADGRQYHLHRGDHLLIPAHCQHKVAWTPSDRTTIWLAVHF
jgi:cupin 2 domain-containing protein